jgi:type IV secretory pathway VirB2 component (pilin)
MTKIKNWIRKFLASPKTRAVALMLLVGGTAAFAQSGAGDYTAGTSALTTVAGEIAKYVPIVVKLCYAIAGVVAIVGAISVYISMNNDEQDVKNILVLQNWLERTRKEVTNKVLSIKQISEFLNFPILAQPTLKKI